MIPALQGHQYLVAIRGRRPSKKERHISSSFQSHSFQSHILWALCELRPGADKFYVLFPAGEEPLPVCPKCLRALEEEQG